MFIWLAHIIVKVKREQLKKAYDDGLAKGYELGWNKDNRGIITGSIIDKEIDEILRKGGE